MKSLFQNVSSITTYVNLDIDSSDLCIGGDKFEPQNF